MEKTKKQVLIEKTDKLIEDACNMMKGKIDKALNCGAIDIESYNGEEVLPRIILCSLLMEAKLVYCICNLTGNQLEESENIYKCM